LIILDALAELVAIVARVGPVFMALLVILFIVVVRLDACCGLSLSS
jgi:hypothetical protein